MDVVVTKNQLNKVDPKLSSETATPAPEKKDPPIFYAKEKLLLTTLKNGSVVHLHGSVEDVANLVFTLPDYMRLYKPDTNPFVLLQEIFKKKTVLFIGYGLEEYEIIEFLINKTDESNKEIRHFMLFGAYEEEGNMVSLYDKYYAELGIQLLPFSRTVNGYEQLVNVIKDWAKKIGPISQEQKFIDKRKLIDEVD
jgi:hypothetical protein